LLKNYAVDFVEICNVYIGKMIIKAAKRILNSHKICPSYSDLNFGVTFLEHSVESRQCHRSECIKILREMLMSWDNVWMTIGQASGRRSLIKWLIIDYLGWGHNIGPVADRYILIIRFTIALRSWSIWCFTSMFKTITMTF